ncbi:Beta-phosphoglucomutase [Caprobacter fermentans]|uniref:Beta-phosphoglucomutase n=1 Tax=Caproicibacter fermentans TaxID=2576756 RepID=A0A6N8I2S1_9FIRM|nr:beta-phosphoglucomutase [Caproicibacter fermentans]MVB12436.1 Beta-phosphoglucomutase [Caproicibacter fermentans]OCN01954.1 beta-phosphoglucomutase [Clostridium sp. W14A]
MKSVIFDLDGVIVSTDDLHFQAWKSMADRNGIPFDRQINNLLRGVSRAESLEIILRKSEKSYSEQQKQELMQYKNDIYVKLLDNLKHSDILPGVVELINRLKKAGVKIAIGSSSKNTRKILQKIGLETVFDAIADGTEIQHSKPDPEVFLVAARKLETKPENCVVVEDAVAGIEAAKAGNMTAIAIGDAASSSLADYRVNTMMQIAEILNLE